jgi:hypothetical protein
MKIIAHRGNTLGPDTENENNPDHITKALLLGFDVEIDLWVVDDALFLGHDLPQYAIDEEFLHTPGLWIHCKNVHAMAYCKSKNIRNNFFWHQEDDMVLTSTGVVWTYPGKPLTSFSVAVMPESRPFRDLHTAYGICTDFAVTMSKLYQR